MSLRKIRNVDPWVWGLIGTLSIVIGLSCFAAAYAEHELQWIGVIF